MTTPQERRPGAADVDVRPLPIAPHTGPGAWHSIGSLPETRAITITWEFSDAEHPGVLYSGAENTARPSVLLSLDLPDGGDFHDFEQEEPNAFTLTGFNTAEAGEARVFAGSIFGQTGPVDFGTAAVAAELRILPHEEFVFVVDEKFAYAVLNISGDLYLEDISLEPETMGFTNAGEKTLHIINAGDEPAVAVLLGGNVD